MTNQFKALARGILLPAPPWKGEVLGLYPKAINILHPDNLLISLVEDRMYMTALSIFVPSLFNGNQTSNPSVGNRAIFKNGKVVLDWIEIDAQGATVWDGSLKVDDIRGFHLLKLDWLGRALLKEGKRGGLLSIIDPDRSYSPLIKGCAKVLDQIVGSNKPLGGFSKIIGLGIGFTPSGDDFISGVLLGERVVKILMNLPGRSNLKPMPIDIEEIQQMLDKTSIAGRTLLWQALRGQFPSYLLRAVGGIAEAEDFVKMLDVVREAVFHGETSGTDALTGLFWYLEIARASEAI